MTTSAENFRLTTDDEVRAFLGHVPYAAFLGYTARIDAQGLLGMLPFAEHLVGNPLLRALHGGAVGMLLESTVILEVLRTRECESPPRMINITLDYRRSGRTVDTFARARITRSGRRVATVWAEAWQEDPAKPIVTANAHLLVG